MDKFPAVFLSLRQSLVVRSQAVSFRDAHDRDAARGETGMRAGDQGGARPNMDQLETEIGMPATEWRCARPNGDACDQIRVPATKERCARPKRGVRDSVGMRGATRDAARDDSKYAPLVMPKYLAASQGRQPGIFECRSGPNQSTLSSGHFCTRPE